MTTAAASRSSPRRCGSSPRRRSGQIVEQRSVGAFTAIAERIDSLHGGLSEAVAIAEVASANSEQVGAAAQQESASAEEIAGTRAELARSAEQLPALVAQFRT